MKWPVTKMHVCCRHSCSIPDISASGRHWIALLKTLNNVVQGFALSALFLISFLNNVVQRFALNPLFRMWSLNNLVQGSQ